MSVNGTLRFRMKTVLFMCEGLLYNFKTTCQIRFKFGTFVFYTKPVAEVNFKCYSCLSFRIFNFCLVFFLTLILIHATSIERTPGYDHITHGLAHSLSQSLTRSRKKHNNSIIPHPLTKYFPGIVQCCNFVRKKTCFVFNL